MNEQATTDPRLRELRFRLERFINLLRRMEYLIRKGEFEQAYLAASSEEREAVTELIRKLNETELKRWFDDQQSKEIEEMSVRELYAIAQQEKILNYKRIRPEQLRAELIRLRDS